MVDILDKKHWDYPWPFKWIPRKWTAVKWGPPKKLWGTQARKRKPVGQAWWSPKPVGEPNSWIVCFYPEAPGVMRRVPLYFAWSGGKAKDGWYRHIRVGLRYDDVEKQPYSTWSIATRRYPSDSERDTSTH